MKNGKKSLKVSDQIELRLPDSIFAEELYEVINNQRGHLREWLSWVDETLSVEDILRFIKTSNVFNIGGQRLTTYIFNGNKIAGSVGLVKIDKNHKYAEVGYWLREDMQGEGIMTQSCERLIDYVFKHLDLNRLEIKIASSNYRSLAIPKKLGFTHEATLREALLLYDAYHDLELFTLLKREHQKLQPS